MGEEEGEIIYL